MSVRLQTLVTAGAAALGCGLFGLLATPGSAADAFASKAASYEIDGGHSSVVFRTKHMGVAWFYGTFNQLEGSFDFDETSPASSSIQVKIKADSLDTRSEQRDGHLKSPDFLASKEFPVIEFKSTKVAKKGDGFAVTGDLTMHGVTKSVTASVTKVGEGETPQGYKAGFVAEFTIDMRDFEFSYVQKHPGGLGPEVELTISLEAARK